MKSFIFKVTLFCLCIFYYPLNAQNLASTEFELPAHVSFVYGFDYHDQWYTQLKPAVAFTFGGDISNWSAAIFNFTAEQRYYYNMLRREKKEKRTDYKSADFISIKPSFRYLHYFSDYKPRNDGYLFATTVNWGLRRAMGKSFYFDGSLGYGLAYLKGDNFGIIGDYGRASNSWGSLLEIRLAIGFVFNKP